jgi:hypothetical protein
LFKKFNNLRAGDLVILSEKKNKNVFSKDIGFGIVSSVSTDDSEISFEINYFIWKKIIIKKKNILLFRQVSTVNSTFREFWGLFSLKKIPIKICKILFSVDRFENFKIFFPKENFVQKHFKNHFNESQINGIFSVLHNRVNLIQGPPGTGKTRTILGIIGLTLWSFFKFYYNDSRKNFYGKNLNLKNFENLIKHQKKNKFCFDVEFSPMFPFKKFTNFPFFYKNYKILGKNNKERIIICAYSNAAIDENTLRISQGLPAMKINFLNKPYSIIRLGPNYKFFLDHMTLDNYALIFSSEVDLNPNIWYSSKALQKGRIKVLKQSLKFDSKNYGTYYQLAKIYKKLENHDLAIKNFEMAKKLNPTKKLIITEL